MRGRLGCDFDTEVEQLKRAVDWALPAPAGEPMDIFFKRAREGT
jgi:hypothetical protein